MNPLVWALLAPARALEGVEAGGEVRAAVRAGLACGETPVLGCPLLDFHDAAVLAPWVAARPAPAVAARGAVTLRLHGGTALPSEDGVEASGDPELLQPVSLRFVDAWVARRGERLDLSVGAQRVAWGVAPGLSVIDEVNPWDLSDPTVFDRRLSTVSAVGTLHRGAWSWQGVWAPWFVPAALPTGTIALMAGGEDLFNQDLGASDDTEIGDVSTRVTVPDASLGNGTLATRMRWAGPRVDLSLSWIHGRDSLPQVDGAVVLTGFQTNTDRVDVGIPVVYPWREVGGLSARGELGRGVVGAAELAVVLPERTSAAPSESQLVALERLGAIDAVPDPIPQTVTQDGAPYLRWIVGVEREIGPVYATAQWLRGFPTERQRSELRDYALLSARWTPRDRLRVQAAVATGAPELVGGGAAGWLVDGELGVLVGDALDLEVGATAIGGADDSPLSGFAAASHLRVGGGLRF